MKALFGVLLAVVLASANANAQELEVGNGLICSTAEQVERTIVQWDKIGSQIVAKINDEAKSAVCGVVPVAYQRGKTVKTVGNKQGRFDIVEILVIGVATPAGIIPVAPMVQYTTFKVVGHDI